MLRVLLAPGGNGLWIRHSFNARHDLVQRIGKGGPSGVINFFKTRLVPIDAEMNAQTCEEGMVIHVNGDEATPWRINGTHIGANHGSENVVSVKSPAHGLTVEDIGSSWKDGNGEVFYLLFIPDADTVWVSSENRSGSPIWEFNTRLAGNVLTSLRDGAILPVAGAVRAQLTPSCRIRKQEFLADGERALTPGEVMECHFLEIIDDNDIINPASAVADIIANPGKEPEFTASRLQAVINNRIVYRFFPNGAATISYKATALQPFQLVFMGFIQSVKLELGTFDTHECYIPKTVAFEQDGISYDFRGLQDFRKVPLSNLVFSDAAKTIAAKDDLPNRFIQFLGRTANGITKREVGYALGYSPIRGVTALAERNTHTGSAGRINDGSAKFYPYALDQRMQNPVAENTVFECEAYRQYFDPAASPNATCLYWHREGGSDVVYIDYHQRVAQEILKLPAHMAGRPFSIVEKTPSVTLHSTGTVPAEGISLSVEADRGFLVLEIPRKESDLPAR